MLNFALFFLSISVIAGILGFGGIAESGAGIAQFMFFVFLGLFFFSLFLGRHEFARYKQQNQEDVTRIEFFK